MALMILDAFLKGFKHPVSMEFEIPDNLGTLLKENKLTGVHMRIGLKKSFPGLIIPKNTETIKKYTT